MTTKNVRLKDLNGNDLNVATLASLVQNNAGKNLGGVEENAQVNVLEGVQLNGSDLAINNKKVNIVVEDAEYSIAAVTTETGFAASYQLTKDGTAVGTKINIPKDMVVQSGTVETCKVAGNPVSTYKKGDKYIDLLLANADNSHIYILVSDLVDVYTQGNGIAITDNTIAIDTSVVATQSDLSTHSSNTALHVTTAEKTTWNGKQNALSQTQLDNIAAVPNKANSADVYTKNEINNMALITYTEIV